MRIAKKSETSEDSSRIDLEAEIRRRAAQSTGHGHNSSVSKSDAGQAGKSGAGRSANPVARPIAKPISQPGAQPVSKINKPVALPKSRGKLIAVIAGLVIMLITAVALGLFIYYRLT